MCTLSVGMAAVPVPSLLSLKHITFVPLSHMLHTSVRQTKATATGVSI